MFVFEVYGSLIIQASHTALFLGQGDPEMWYIREPHLPKVLCWALVTPSEWGSATVPSGEQMGLQ